MLLGLLSVGRPADPATLPEAAFVRSAGTVAEVDAALAGLAPARRLVVEADLAGLNLVLARLLRAGRLAEQETAVLLAEPTRYLAGLGLPADRAGQLAVARTGAGRLVGLIRDDSGGVCLTDAELTPWTPGPPWWVRAVVDDQRLCDGTVRRVRVRQTGPAELVAEVRTGRLGRRRHTGRALQLACDPARIVADGIVRERPRGRRTYWADPALWRLALPG